MSEALNVAYSPESVTPETQTTSTDQSQLLQYPGIRMLLPQNLTQDASTAILNKLEAMVQKRWKLDWIEKDITELKAILTSLEFKVHSLTTVLNSFVSHLVNWLKNKINSSWYQITSRSGPYLDALRKVNVTLRENLIDQRARSMRDNLIFSLIAEQLNTDVMSTGHCETWEQTEGIFWDFL